jgi:hypothetical protein
MKLKYRPFSFFKLKAGFFKLQSLVLLGDIRIAIYLCNEELLTLKKAIINPD